MWLQLQLNDTLTDGGNRLELQRFVRKVGQDPVTDQKILLQQKRARLRTKINQFNQQATTFIHSLNRIIGPRTSSIERWEDLEDLDLDSEVPQSSTFAMEDAQIEESLPPERQPLTLPSALDCNLKDEVALRELSSCELQLRIGQANDALHNARLSIAQKSYLLRTRVRNNAPTQSYVTRSYGETQTIQTSIEQSAKTYRLARKAMVKLGMPASDLAKYRLLEKDDLRASTAIADSNAPGQRSDSLSWIWHMSSDTHRHDPAYLDECTPICHFTLLQYLILVPVYRVNWLRTKARRDRWVEEKELLRSELEWTRIFFEQKASMWRVRVEASTAPGLICYAYGQARNWDLLVQQASNALRSM